MILENIHNVTIDDKDRKLLHQRRKRKHKQR